MVHRWFLQRPITRNIAIAVVVVAAIAGLFYGIAFQGDITGFFRIGSVLPLSPFLEGRQPLIWPDQIGYDGQQFLSIALDPGLQDPGTIAALDSPRYRYQRILYPLLGYLLGGGQPMLIPYALVGLNVASIIGLVWVTSRYLQPHRETWQGLLVLAIPGVWMVFSLSTADLLTSFLLVIAIANYRANHPRAVAIALALACLARETMLLVWLAVVLTSLWERKRKQLRSLLWVPLPVAAWGVYAWARLGTQDAPETNNIGLPLVGIARKFASFFSGDLPPKQWVLESNFFLLLLVFAAAIAISLQALSANRLILIATSLYGVLFAVSSIVILSYYVDYSRVYMDVYLLLLLNNSPSPWLKLFPLVGSACASGIYLYAAISP